MLLLGRQLGSRPWEGPRRPRLAGTGIWKRSWPHWERGDEEAPEPFLTHVSSEAAWLSGHFPGLPCVPWILLHLIKFQWVHTGGNMSKSDGWQQ